jgi:hypothetical protein
MKLPLSVITMFCVLSNCFSQEVIRSTNRDRVLQRQTKKLGYNTGLGVSYNHLMNSNANFGFQLQGTVINELELFERFRLGFSLTGFLGGINQTVLLNNGSVFDEDRAPSGGIYWPYIAFDVYKSPRISIAPQAGYQWHIFGNENINFQEPFQGFSAKGIEYGLTVNYRLQQPSESNRSRILRFSLNYSQLKINGQPSQILGYGFAVQYIMQMFNNRISRQ